MFKAIRNKLDKVAVSLITRHVVILSESLFNTVLEEIIVFRQREEVYLVEHTIFDPSFGSFFSSVFIKVRFMPSVIRELEGDKTHYMACCQRFVFSLVFRHTSGSEMGR